MAAFSPGKNPGTQLVDSRGGLDSLEKNKETSRESNPRLLTLLPGHYVDYIVPALVSYKVNL
jgi:hypothetical protein